MADTKIDPLEVAKNPTAFTAEERRKAIENVEDVAISEIKDTEKKALETSNISQAEADKAKLDEIRKKIQES